MENINNELIPRKNEIENISQQLHEMENKSVDKLETVARNIMNVVRTGHATNENNFDKIKLFFEDICTQLEVFHRVHTVNEHYR